jgi:methyl-accepting chemotaxis protein
MKRLRDMSLRWQMLIAPALLTLFVVVIEASDLRALSRTETATARLFGESVARASGLEQVRTFALELNGRMFRAMTVAQGGAPEKLVRNVAGPLGEDLERLGSMLATVGASARQAGHDQDAARLAELSTKYRQSGAQFAKFLFSDPSMAVDFATAAGAFFQDLDAVLKTLAGDYQASENADFAALRNDAQLAGRISLLLGLIAIAIGIAASLWLSRFITRPLGRAIEIARAVADGKLDNAIDAHGRDETAQLLSSLESMQKSLLENELNAKGQIAAISRAQAVIELSLDGTIRRANDNFLKLFGYDAAAVNGQSEEMFIASGADPASAARVPWNNLQRGEPHAGQYRRIANGGRVVHVHVTYSPIMDLSGKPFKVVAYLTDVTEQVTMKDALDAAVAETRAVVDAAIDGRLTERVPTAGRSGPIEDMSISVNALLESMMKLVTAIKCAAAEVQGGAQEISQGNLNLSERTEAQASSLEETASSMEEMTATIKHNADNAAQANQLAVDARSAAEMGGEVVARAVTAMQSINAASKRIADIIGVIDEIAFQTNLLALNAAVEAARAGEQGRGFAVVAAEVRTLASRSAAAAKEIKALIQDSVLRVAEGSKLVDQSGHTLIEIVSAVKRLTDIVAEFTTASREQAAGIEQVNGAITSMDETTQQNAALVEQAAAAATALRDQATELANLTDRYDVEGAPVAAARGTVRAAAAAGRRTSVGAWGPAQTAVSG